MVVESRRGLMLWLLALTTPVLLLTTGCTPSVPAAVRHATAVVVFIDFSGSISGQDRVSFRREIESEILSSLAPGLRPPPPPPAPPAPPRPAGRPAVCAAGAPRRAARRLFPLLPGNLRGKPPRPLPGENRGQPPPPPPPGKHLFPPPPPQKL